MKKVLRIMKVMTFFLFAMFFQVSAAVFSQNSGLINLKAENEPLKEILKLIEDQSSNRFLYNSKNINVEQKTSVDCQAKSIEEVLDVLFKGTDIKYRSFEKTYVLFSEGRERLISSRDLFTSSQQQKTVSGKVTDSSVIPLPGVTVVIKGTTQGTITNAEGEYSLTDVPENATLQFSFVGMKTQEIPVDGKISINVTMAEEAIGIEEVVAIGYGTINVENVTSSVSSIREDEFVGGAINDAAQLFKGKVPGVIINTTSGNPLNTSEISLRGKITLMGTSDPLILIDGIPGGLRDVSPDQIESISVLKDASAAAIYGTRGSNGVINITTKSGIYNATSVNIKSYITTQEITNKVDVMNASQYRELIGETVAWDVGYETDWLKEITQTPISQSHDVSLRGGWEKANYLLSFRFNEENGLIKRSNINIIQPRIEVNQKLFNDKLKIKGILNGNLQQYYPLLYQENAYAHSFVFNPTAPVKKEDGEFYENFAVQQDMYQNPVALLEEAEGEVKSNRLKIQGSASYNPIKNLFIELVGSRTSNQNIGGTYLKEDHPISLINGKSGIASRSTSNLQEDVTEISTEYSKKFLNKHDFKFLGGFSWNRTLFEQFQMNNYNFSTDKLLYNSIGNGSALTEGNATMSSYKRESKLIGFFARINYNYKNKYLLMASIRHEGSSKFGKDNKWGNFPSMSLGWNIYNEPFLNSVSFFSQLKLRAGYGVTGNIPTDSYLSLSTYGFGNKALVNGEWISVIMPTSNPNPGLKWETKEELNIGLDFGFFSDRLSGTIDIYKQSTNNMLWDYTVPNPPYLYDSTIANAVKMENLGLELQLNMVLFNSGGFNWSSSISYSTNRNEVKSLSSENFQIAAGYFYAGNVKSPVILPSHKVEIGEPIGNFFGYKAIDIDEDGYWIIEGSDGNPKSVIDEQPEDRQILGNGIPKHNLSWNNSLGYRNLSLDVQMYGAFDFQILNNRRIFLEPPVALARGNVLTQAFDNIFGKRPLNAEQSMEYNSYYIENGDYWKISNVTLNYNFNINNAKIFLKRGNLFVSVNNVYTITGYKGIDPEVSIKGLDPGTDPYNRYPATRTYTLGLSLEF